ncbi:MAG TPA: hypothetical protein VKW06_16195 [Candidatus Angelobacter sp.]|nr:hypothetical protein [Candidatus Angelobacter sp.]
MNDPNLDFEQYDDQGNSRQQQEMPEPQWFDDDYISSENATAASYNGSKIS